MTRTPEQSAIEEPAASCGKQTSHTFAVCFSFLLIVATATNVRGMGFTNRVRVVEDISFAVRDYFGRTNMFDVHEIEATNKLHYIIQGTGTNTLLRAALRRDEMPVVLDLIDSNGKPVSRTPKGLTNALVPAREANIVGGATVTVPTRQKPEPVRGEAIRSTSRLVHPVGRLTEFFNIKDPGIYTLEARLRYWCPTNKTWTWFLTGPVRLPVVVRDPKSSTTYDR